MKLRKKIIWFILVPFFFFFAGNAIANNSLSRTYYTAFVAPYEFESLLNTELNNNPNFYNQFEACSQLAPGILAQIENQQRQEYSVCPNNARCTQLANNIQTVMDLRTKVNGLINYIRDKRNGAGYGFLNSKIGQTAIFVDNYHKNMGIDIRNNPIFIQEMAILESLVCQ